MLSNLIVPPPQPPSPPTYFLIPPPSIVVLDACGLRFRIWGGEDKKQGRSHSFHFLAEGDEHILAEWKTKGRHRGGGRLLCVCAESRDGAGTCAHLFIGGAARSHVLEVLTLAFLLPLTGPIKHTICSPQVSLKEESHHGS